MVDELQNLDSEELSRQLFVPPNFGFEYGEQTLDRDWIPLVQG